MGSAGGGFLRRVTRELGGRAISLPHGAVSLKPDQVGVARRNEGKVGPIARGAGARRLKGFRVTPTVSFHVSIGKREHTRAEVFDGRPMPEPTRVAHEKDESGVT